MFVSCIDSYSFIVATAEFSIENVLCYESIQSFEAAPSKEQSDSIYTMYIMTGALLEVNVRQQHRNQVYTKMQEQILSSTLFEAVKTALQENMKDTISRFIRSSEYKNYLKRIQNNSAVAALGT